VLVFVGSLEWYVFFFFYFCEGRIKGSVDLLRSSSPFFTHFQVWLKTSTRRFLFPPKEKRILGGVGAHPYCRTTFPHSGASGATHNHCHATFVVLDCLFLFFSALRSQPSFSFYGAPLLASPAPGSLLASFPGFPHCELIAFPFPPWEFGLFLLKAAPDVFHRSVVFMVVPPEALDISHTFFLDTKAPFFLYHFSRGNRPL